mmetsp:Transcript_97551/g.259121  ORF Transcript_97551/g.259121 Transcript_97551/m.259121 type:complete len:228 (-) Transcript_97551:193-876(-)
MMSSMAFASAPTKRSTHIEGRDELMYFEKDVVTLAEGEEPPCGKLFKITVDRGDNFKKLGISMYDGIPELAGVVTELAENSLMEGTRIRKFDRLVAMNGKRAMEADRLMKVMKHHQIIEMLVKRPKLYAFKIRKEDQFGLGLQLGYSEVDQFLLIQNINAGPVKKLNTQYKDREIREYDAIVSVNGMTGTADDLISEMEAHEVLTFGMMRWFSKEELHDLTPDTSRS